VEKQNAAVVALLSGATPIKMWTYETASARSRIIELENCYELVIAFVIKHFGRNHMDNKITLVLKPKDSSQEVYCTYWDGKLSIGLDVYMLVSVEDLLKPTYSYRTILPIK
jgi:hypothetical protein